MESRLININRANVYFPATIFIDYSPAESLWKFYKFYI